jgi:uncharacterized protein YndB with AHSA1/START domain
MIARSPVAVQVSGHFAAAAEQVFDAWLDPASLGYWLFGPEVRERLAVASVAGPRSSVAATKRWITWGRTK